jgi:hypothetical protein
MALQVLLDLRLGAHGATALLTLATLARGMTWKAPAQAAAARLRSSTALTSGAARLAPLLQVCVLTYFPTLSCCGADRHSFGSFRPC